MTIYNVTLEFCVNISVEAESPEEAEEKAKDTDATEVIDSFGECFVLNVEEE